MKISIPKPCNENWNEMSPEQQGAFCKVCSKVVVDFSNMSDEEVLNYFAKKKEEKTCGRFRVSQLSPYELKINLRSVAAQKSFPKIFAASLFIFFSSLFICKSDTGEQMMFNVVPDTADTSTFVLRADSVSTATTDTTSFAPIDSTEINPMIMGGMTVPVEEAVVIDTVKPITGGNDREPMIVGDIRVQPAPTPMILGKIACARPTKKEIERITKKKRDEQKVKGNLRLLGEVDF